MHVSAPLAGCHREHDNVVQDELLRPLCVRLAATYTGYARGVPPALLAHFLGRLADIGTPGYTMVTPQQLLVRITLARQFLIALMQRVGLRRRRPRRL